MKRKFLILVMATIVFMSYAQNPFAGYGYDVQVVTLSNGQFDESHDDTQVVEIGSVRFNTKTGKIIGVAENDTVVNVPDPQIVSRFISIDPLAEKYYSISPYAYCNNSPINCVDPDGRDWYRHNETGNYFWQEGHDDLEGYTNIGSSVSIQLGKNSYFNAYQNAGVMANQAVDAFDLIFSSGKLQNKFLGKNSPLSEDSKSELFNGLVNRETNEIGQKAGQALLTAEMVMSGVGFLGRLGTNLLIRNAAKGGIQIGQNFGKLGAVVQNPGLSIANFSKHGLNQAITRGVNPATILNTIKNPIAVLQQSRGNYLYLTREAAVVINPAGRVVSTYPASMFDSSILNVLKGF